MTPWEYASRYLPVMVPGPAEAYAVTIGQYRLVQSKEAPAGQQELYGAVGDYLVANQRKDKGFRLKLLVNGETLFVTTRQEILMSLVRPFYGKGSPEDCQIVLQLALLCNVVRKPELLQQWADKNLGLDCNGYVGNYIYHDVLRHGWRETASEKEPGPSTDISTIFRWAAGAHEQWAVDDLSKIEPGCGYMIVRVGADGRVIPGGPNSMVGHIAVTMTGEVRLPATTGTPNQKKDAFGFYSPLAMRTVESAGPVKGVGRNWLTFLEPTPIKTVFKVTRDNIPKIDLIKIAPFR